MKRGIEKRSPMVMKATSFLADNPGGLTCGVLPEGSGLSLLSWESLDDDLLPGSVDELFHYGKGITGVGGLADGRR
jgi:hypothetical protein